jgi:hypothetical protein
MHRPRLQERHLGHCWLGRQHSCWLPLLARLVAAPAAKLGWSQQMPVGPAVAACSWALAASLGGGPPPLQRAEDRGELSEIAGVAQHPAGLPLWMLSGNTPAALERRCSYEEQTIGWHGGLMLDQSCKHAHSQLTQCSTQPQHPHSRLQLLLDKVAGESAPILVPTSGAP